MDRSSWSNPVTMRRRSPSISSMLEDSRSHAALRRLARVTAQPAKIVRAVARHVLKDSFDLSCEFDAHDRPMYAYGIQQAARLAQRLGIPRISVIEFGVAGGQGLIEMEHLASLAAQAIGVEINVYGFDSGTGMPEPVDYRDVPYKWQAGFYTMNVDALNRRLTHARLIVGDIEDTVPSFLRDRSPAPIGFVAFDLDFYSSTASALRLFDGPHQHFLPRVLSYFDNTVVFNDYVLQNPYVGELAAIQDFNDDHMHAKLAPIHGLAHKRLIPAPWNDSMYALHRFDHPDYCVYIGPAEQQQLDIE